MIKPVTETLMAQLNVLLQTHAIVSWLDKDGHYTEFVDALIDGSLTGVNARVLGYRGSYLEVMRRLAQLGDAIEPERLIVHVPGANQDSITRTPLLEINAQYQHRKGLETLIRDAAAGRIKPDEVDAFLAGGEVSLAAADAWMARHVAPGDGETEIMLRVTDPGRLIDDLVRRGQLFERLSAEQLPAVWHFMAAQTGLPDRWPSAERRVPPADASEHKRLLADTAAKWVLSVEYVHDLQQRGPKAELLVPASAVARPLIEACRAAAMFLRSHAPHYYVGVADDLEDQIAVERDAGSPDELGRVDTFRFEEDRLLVAALRALDACDWPLAAKWADQRLAGKSVWLELDHGRRRAWELVELATRFGTAISASTLARARLHSLDDAAERYAEQGAAIDRMHREFEQVVARELHASDLPHADAIRVAVVRLRACWLDWAEQLAQAWTKVCEDESPLPSASRQQRHVFEQVVMPLLTSGERVAYFMIDGLRYEMAEYLRDLIGSPTATLKPWLAELPTVTEVGMTALLPIAKRGKLQVELDDKQQDVKGFRAGERLITSRSGRETHLHRASGGAKWLELEDVEREGNLSHKIKHAKLVVVHGTGIDKSGDHGFGLAHFASELRSVHKAWELLRAAGVRTFVFTADHGFLLRSGETLDEPLVHGRKHDASARYAIYPSAITQARRLTLPLRSLHYEGSEAALLVPRGLEVFMPGRDRNYVHGGNSPQERVIPVLVVQHRHAASGEDQRYRVEIRESSQPEPGSGGRHVLHARVVRADNQTTLELAGDAIPLELRVVDGVRVSIEPIDAQGATLDAGRIDARVGAEFSVSFRLAAEQEQRVRVELVGATARWQIEAATSKARFTALAPTSSGSFPIVPVVREPAAAAPTPTVATGTWIDEFEEPELRKVMQHIDQHGSISEADLIQLLGPRPARKFAREFDKHRKRTPFVMEQQHTAAGKVYRKVTDA